ncbi:MAG: efflux RND transporter periplasmic adaptor subunit, partial [Thermoanaerobaculia bacterium]|nr:efflux RND transporter periplasmic adaptor subunit [Thermoanaerobaculia bacterium]
EIEEVRRAVRVIEVEPVDFVPRAVGYGTVAPSRVWEAVAQVAGKVVEKHPELERGRLLEAGTVILRIDPADYELAIARSQANLESAEAQLAELEVTEANTETSLEIERRALALARADLERERALLGRGNISQAAVDQTETELLNRRQRVQELDNQLRLFPAERRVLEASIALNRAQLQSARLDLERTTVRLPFDGRIAEVNVEPTEFVGIGEVLVVADSIDVAEVEAQFPLGQLLPLARADTDLTTLSAAELAAVPRQFGLEAEVRLQTDEVRASWDARFDRLGDRIDPQTRTVGVIVAVDDPYRKAIPGTRPPLVKDMFVQVVLRGRPWADAMVVPRVAVHRSPDGRPVVYLVDAEARLEIRPVTLGPAQDDLVVVRDGLAPGARVVVSDLIPASAGMRLEPSLDAAAAEQLRAQATGDGTGPLGQ